MTFDIMDADGMGSLDIQEVSQSGFKYTRMLKFHSSHTLTFEMNLSNLKLGSTALQVHHPHVHHRS